MSYLIVRYAEGAGGSFLTCVLAASKSVWHWDSFVQLNKTEELAFRYIQDRFKPDFNNWIARDPKPFNDYNLHFLSSKYPRGDDLSLEEFTDLCNQHSSVHFLHGINSGLKVIIPWHKLYVPVFFQNSKIISISIDPLSIKWYHRCLWYKKFGIKNGMIHIKADDPAYNPTRLKYFKKFNNPYLINKPFIPFVKENIIKNKQKLNFLNLPSNLDQSIICLSDMLNTNKFVNHIQRLCDENEICCPSKSFLENTHNYWLKCHTPILKIHKYAYNDN